MDNRIRLGASASWLVVVVGLVGSTDAETVGHWKLDEHAASSASSPSPVTHLRVMALRPRMLSIHCLARDRVSQRQFDGNGKAALRNPRKTGTGYFFWLLRFMNTWRSTFDRITGFSGFFILLIGQAMPNLAGA